MLKGVKFVRLDKLNLPAEALRKKYSPAAYLRLKKSIQQYGILVPLLVRNIGRDEFAVVDGITRVRIMRELGYRGSTPVPVSVLEIDDRRSLSTSLIVNQTRERISSLGELFAFRSLLEDYKLNIQEATKELGKSKPWGTYMARVLKLPSKILRDVYNGSIPVSHAIVMGRYLENQKILEMLYEESKKGGISKEKLFILAKLATKVGVERAKKYRPKYEKISDRSWVRVEPLIDGHRFEVHAKLKDNKKVILKKIDQILTHLGFK
jgi:ParB family chromosome partitioning protein